MIYFKYCPRCKGDMYRDKDSYGLYLDCLQCGHIIDIEPNPPVSGQQPDITSKMTPQHSPGPSEPITPEGLDDLQ